MKRNPNQQFKEEEKGRGHKLGLPELVPFHRWVLCLGLILLVFWLPFYFWGELMEKRIPQMAGATKGVPAFLYTLGFWFTTIGVVLEVAYCVVCGFMIRNNEHAQFSDLSGRSRFRRRKTKYIGIQVETEEEADIVFELGSGPVEK